MKRTSLSILGMASMLAMLAACTIPQRETTKVGDLRPDVPNLSPAERCRIVEGSLRVPLSEKCAALQKQPKAELPQ